MSTPIKEVHCNRKSSCKSFHNININNINNINININAIKRSKLLLLALLLCSNHSANGLKLTPVPKHQNNKIDLTTEARLVNAALAEATSTIKSSYSFIKNDEAEAEADALLQEKQFQRLSSAIDRWNRVSPNIDSNHQSLMLDEVSRSVAASKALLGTALFRSKKDSQALPLLENSCPLLWGTIYDIETDILLDCYTALGSLYLKNDRQAPLEKLQTDLISHMPWLKYALIDNAVEKSHISDLDSVELIKLVIDLSSIERKIISTETRRAWIASDEIRLSMNTLVAEFTVADSERKKRSVLNKSKKIVDDLLERHKVASLASIRKISDSLKNTILQSTEIPTGLNQGNVKEHIIKLSTSIIHYLKSEIEMEATYYLDIMESVIDKGKAYSINSQDRHEDRNIKVVENSHGFQSKADVQLDVHQIMEYIKSKHENSDIHNSLGPFSNRKKTKTEHQTAASTSKKAQTQSTDKKNQKQTTKKSTYYSYTILSSGVVGIVILAFSNFFYSTSIDNKQNSTRGSKGKLAPKSERTLLTSLAKAALGLVNISLSFILYQSKAALSPSDIDDELIKELTEKPRKNLVKKDGNKNAKDKKKRNSLDSTKTSASDEVIETKSISSSSSEIPPYEVKTSDRTSANVTINTSFSRSNDMGDYVVDESILNTDDWIVSDTDDWIVTNKKKSPIQKKEFFSMRRDKKHSTAIDAKAKISRIKSNNAEVKSKAIPTVNETTKTTGVVKERVPLSLSQLQPAKDYRSATSSGLSVDRKSHSSPSSSSSPKYPSQPSSSSTDNEDRSTDDSDLSIENGINSYPEPMMQPYYQGQPYFVPESVMPPILNENMMYRMNMPQFLQQPNPQMMPFQGPEGQLYFMPYPMQMQPYMTPADSVGFIPSMPAFGSFNNNSNSAPLTTQNRDDIISRIRTQIEYYFSEENLRKDQYLKSTMDAEGYVSLAKIKAFRRIQQLGADASIMLDAVKSSAKLHVIESVRDNKEETSDDTMLNTKIASISWKNEYNN